MIGGPLPHKLVFGPCWLPKTAQSPAKVRASPIRHIEKESPRAARSEDSRKADPRELKEEVKQAVKREPKVEMARARADRVGPAVRHNTTHMIAHRIHNLTEVRLTRWQIFGPKVKSTN